MSDAFARLRELSAPGALVDPELLVSLIDKLPDGIVVVDPDGHIRLVNTACELIFGYHRSDLYHMTVHDLLPEDLRTRHGEHLRRFFLDPKARPMGLGLVLEGLHRHGTRIPLDINLNPIVTAQGLYAVAAVRRRRDDPRP